MAKQAYTHKEAVIAWITYMASICALVGLITYNYYKGNPIIATLLIIPLTFMISIMFYGRKMKSDFEEALLKQNLKQ